MECEVRTEDGQSHDDLVRMIRMAVGEVTPHIEAVTGLPVGEGVLVRLMSPAQYVSATRRYMHRLLNELAASHDEEKRALAAGARRAVRMVTPFLRATWRMSGGQTVPPQVSAFPEVWLMPKALAAMGAPRESVYAILAHELTHVAQFNAAPGIVAGGLGRLLGEVSFEGSPLLEGHAQWTHRAVTKMLFGTEVKRLAGPNPSVASRIVRLVARATPLSEKAAHYDQGHQFVEKVVTAEGVVFLNRVWSDLDLVPTAAELQQPSQWIERIRDAAPAA